MIGPSPIVSTAAAASSATGSTASSNLNELGPDAFITLLTAQLQAQDPLNPMDPNQMVSELTSMNTLQEIIQIRQDMDSLLSTQSSPGNTGGVSHASSAASSMFAGGAPPLGTPAISTTPAAAVISSGLAALVTSMTPSSGSSFHSQLNSKSQVF